LWIDALCILQDSPADWASQSELMSSIYGNSHLTLSAMSSSHGDEGFLTLRDPYRRLKTRFLAVGDAPGCYIHVRYPQYEISKKVLMSRGWILQELLLSPRVLHYTSTQLVFDCNIETFAEGGHSNDTPFGSRKRLLHHKADSEHARWYSIVEVYSRCDLTRESDKLHALAGLARRMYELTGDTYIAGLWKNDLKYGLLWTAGREDLQSITCSATPSWSWASFRGSVFYPNTHRRTELYPQIKIQTDPTSSFTEPSISELRITGYTRRLERQRIHGLEFINDTGAHQVSFSVFGIIPPAEWPQNILQIVYDDINDLGKRERFRRPEVCFRVRFDTGQIPDEDNIWCLSFLDAPDFASPPRRKDMCQTLSVDGLVLSCLDDGQNLFRRVGVFDMRDLPAVESGVCTALNAERIFYAGAQRKEVIIV
jgi:hypothetical protein